MSITVEIKPKSDDNFVYAKFGLHVVDQAKTERILCVLPGINSDGLPVLNKKHWQDRATQLNACLFSFHFIAHDYDFMDIVRGNLDSRTHYGDCRGGSGAAFNEGLKQCLEKAGLSLDLSHKLLMYGFSAGGIFSHNYAALFPERVIAFTVNKASGPYIDSTVPHSVPAIVFMGEIDKEYRNERIEKLYQRAADAKADWCLVREANIAHEVGASADLAMGFFQKVCRIVYGD